MIRNVNNYCIIVCLKLLKGCQSSASLCHGIRSVVGNKVDITLAIKQVAQVVPTPVHTNQLVPDIHIAQGLSQDGASFLHSPVCSSMERRPAIIVLDIQIKPSLDQEPEERSNIDFCP